MPTLRPTRRLLIPLLTALLLSLPPLAQTQEPEPPVRLILVGDVMIGRHVAEQVAVHGPDYPLSGVWALLRQADLAFGNLESPLTRAPRAVRNYNLTADPDLVSLLVEAGFDVLSLANNHATDHGREGLLETYQVLEAVGLTPVGAGADEETARAPVIKEVHGVRVAFLAFEGLAAALPARADAPGVARLQPLASAEKDVRAARESADWVIVGVHWGVEYEPLPTLYQRQVAQRLADAGADVVVGHHPHVLEPLAWVQGQGRSRPTLVAYSLGNFLFDQDFSAPTTSSVALHLVLGKDALLALGVTPTRTHAGAAQEAAPEEAPAILESLLAGGEAKLPWTVLDPLEGGRQNRYWLAHPPQPAPRAGGTVWGLRYRGGLRLYAGRNLAWRSSPGTQVSAWGTADLDGDGRDELIASQRTDGGYELHVWAPGPGSLAGAPIWNMEQARQPLEQPLVSITAGDLEGDGVDELLVAVPGPGKPAGAPAARLELWRWNGRGFDVLWQSPPGAWQGGTFWDADGDGLPEVVTVEGTGR